MINVFQAPDELKAGNVLPAIEIVGLADDKLLVDFNKIVQESLDSSKDRLNKLKAIIRCDNLPHIQAKANDMRRLCDTLIRLILHYPPQNSKLFIYIKCIHTDNDILPYGDTSHLDIFDICFHTNSCNEASWKTAHQEVIARCGTICSQYAGTFSTALGPADCLFKLTLPGKLI